MALNSCWAAYWRRAFDGHVLRSFSSKKEAECILCGYSALKKYDFELLMGV